MLYRNFFTVVQYKYEHPRISVEWHTKYFYYQPVVGHIFLEPLSLYGLFLRLIISLVALFGFFQSPRICPVLMDTRLSLVPLIYMAKQKYIHPYRQSFVL